MKQDCTLLGAEQCVDAGLSRCPYESDAELREARQEARLVARALTALNRKVANVRIAIEVQLHEQENQSQPSKQSGLSQRLSK
jgi:hypothetical protein